MSTPELRVIAMLSLKTRPPQRLAESARIGTVLVVDDDPFQRIELSHGLNRAGAAVVQCARGDEVLSAIASAHPGLVILDVCLPGRNGDELARDIAAAHPEVKILLMTGDLSKCTEVNGAHLPVFAVLEKPVPLRALIRFVRSALMGA